MNNFNSQRRKKLRPIRPVPPKATQKVPELRGTPWSREWLVSCIENGVADGFIIFDAEKSALIFDGSNLTPETVLREATAAHGSPPQEFCLNGKFVGGTDR